MKEKITDSLRDKKKQEIRLDINKRETHDKRQQISEKKVEIMDL